MRRPSILVSAPLAGVLLALGGLTVHRDTWRLGAFALPWGLVLALGTTLAVVVAASTVLGPAGAPLVAAGWVVCILVVLQGRPEGDYLLAADGLGQAFLWGGLVAVAVGGVVGGALGARAAGSPER